MGRAVESPWLRVRAEFTEAVKGHPAKDLGADEAMRWGTQCGWKPGTQSQALICSLVDLGHTWMRQDRPEAHMCTKNSRLQDPASQWQVPRCSAATPGSHAFGTSHLSLTLHPPSYTQPVDGN